MASRRDFLILFSKFAIVIVPFPLFIVLPIYPGLRYFWKKTRKRKTAGEIFKDEINNDL